jgi:uncharacterized membrane protein
MSSTVDVTRTPESGEQRRNFTLRHLSAVLVVLALLVTGYMAYTKLSGGSMVCIESGPFDCSAVESSPWARVMGVPTALLGFIAHVLIGSILFLETRSKFFREYGVLMLFGITLFGIMYHSYLIFVSVTIIKALCPWCLTAASIMLIQFIISSIRLRRHLTTA